jgi:hypothetical protein
MKSRQQQASGLEVTIQFFVGAGSLLKPKLKSAYRKMTDDTKPALTTQQPTTFANIKNTYGSMVAKRAGHKYIANDTIYNLDIESVNKPFSLRKSAITPFANDTIGFTKWNPTTIKSNILSRRSWLGSHDVQI